MHCTSIRSAALIAAFLCLLAAAPQAASGQRRDYMTDAEIELVRDAQDIDARMDVLTKMIDRRLSALGVASGGWTVPPKQSEAWGEEPKGNRLQLLGDIRSLLQKAIDDIDDVATHNESTQTQNKVQGELFPKAVRLLAAAAARYEGVLKLLAERSTDEREKGLVASALEMCGDIRDAAAKLPPEPTKGKRKN